MCYRAAVVSVRDFGAFVKIPGYHKQGLVHMSQMAPHRLERSEIAAFVREGEGVWIKVLAIEGAMGQQQRIACSMKVVDQETGRDLDPENEEGQRRAAERDSSGGAPRERLSQGPPGEGTVHRCTVKSLQTFGAFCSVAGHAKQGLLHISAISDGQRVEASDLEQMLPVGTEVWAKVEKVDPATGKYGLSMKRVDQATGEDLDPSGDAAVADVERRGGGGGGKGRGGGAPAEPGAMVRGFGAQGVQLDWGHLAAENYAAPDAGKYALVSDGEDDEVQQHGGAPRGGAPRTLADVWRDGPVVDLQEAKGPMPAQGAEADNLARAEALLREAEGGDGGSRHKRKRDSSGHDNEDTTRKKSSSKHRHRHRGGGKSSDKRKHSSSRHKRSSSDKHKRESDRHRSSGSKKHSKRDKDRAHHRDDKPSGKRSRK